jgi:hypothetical protein
MLARRRAILYKGAVIRLSFAELERFYQGLVTKARRRGVTCAITSGMV